MRPYQDKDWLYKKYIVERLSCEEIGRLCGVHRTTVYRWLVHYRIKTRTIQEAKAVKNKMTIQEALEIFQESSNIDELVEGLLEEETSL